MRETEEMKISFFRKNSSIYLIFGLIILLCFLIRFSFVGLIPLWREDGYHYLVKAEEILKGDFTPKWAEIGLPLFYSFFLLFFGSGDIFEDTRIAEVLQAFLECLIIIPLFLIALKFFKWKGAIIASVLFTFWPGLIHWTMHGYTEALFIFLVLFSFYFLIKSEQNRTYLLIASGFAVLAFYVRFNGIFLLPFILVFAWIWRREIPKWNWRWLAYIVLVFILVASPYFALRMSSPQYSLEGRAARYLFSDDHQQLFDPEFRPTLSSYLSTHSLRDIFSRGWRGIKIIIQDTYKVNYFLMTLAFIGLLFFTKKKFLSFHLVFLFYFLGLFWIYAVVRSLRLVLPLVPFAIILSGGLVSKIFEGKKKAGVWMSLVIVFFIFVYGQNFLAIRDRFRGEGEVWGDARKWGMWIAQNIPPGETMAMREGIDIANMQAPQIELKTIPRRGDINEIWSYLENNRINYIAIGSGGLEAADWRRIPALRQIRARSLAPFLVKIYSDEKLKWIMEIFKINWDKKGVLYKRGAGDVVEAESLTVEGISRFDSEASQQFTVLAKDGTSENNSILLGPVRGVPPGKYRVTFRLKAKDHAGADFLTGLSVLLLKTDEVIWKRNLRGNEFLKEGIYQKFESFFKLTSKKDLHFRITSQGSGELWVDNFEFSHVD